MAAEGLRAAEGWEAADYRQHVSQVSNIAVSAVLCV